ncbi:MAG: hypothetical protein WCC60_24220 [Ilumatobacteraceae bacterium]
MSSASPDDLAVTFRSVPRRLREAQGDAPHASIANPASELHGLLAEAGRLLGTNEDPVALAEAVSAVHADAWDDAVLDRLREIALDLGRLLRHIAALAEGQD